MNATKARDIFLKVNKSLSLEEKIKLHASEGFPGMSVPRMNENDPKLKKLEKKGYLISHSNSNTYITWAW